MTYARRKAGFVSKRMNRSGIVRRSRADTGIAGVLSFIAALAFFAGCAAPNNKVYVHMETLEVAAEARLAEPQRAVVLDEALFARFVRPVNDRVALVEIHDEQGWQTFNAGCAGLGARPDFAHGMFVGVLTRLGQPLDGEWPCELQAVRVVDGAGLVSASLRGGTYLPDGMTCVDGAFVYGLKRALVLEINGDRFVLK
ncbi:MAG: hypothetical protein JNG88_05435 [Phycisphaerales bacterium]|nr:hypothetical protein [Phycisphaerales bacterium]